MIGLNDVESKLEEVNRDDLIELIEHVFITYKINFSLSLMDGGYSYNNDKFICENSVNITCITNTTEGMDEFVDNLKMLLNQESILVTKKQLEVEYV